MGKIELTDREMLCLAIVLEHCMTNGVSEELFPNDPARIRDLVHKIDRGFSGFFRWEGYLTGEIISTFEISWHTEAASSNHSSNED